MAAAQLPNDQPQINSEVPHRRPSSQQNIAQQPLVQISPVANRALLGNNVVCHSSMNVDSENQPQNREPVAYISKNEAAVHQNNDGAARSSQLQPQNRPNNQGQQDSQPPAQAAQGQPRIRLEDFQYREESDEPELINPNLNQSADPMSFRILHQENFRPTKLLTKSS